VFAPIAAALATGVAPDELGTIVRAMQRVRVPRSRRRGKQVIGTVLWSDGFGNLATNVTAADLAAAGFRRRRLSITIAGHVVPFRPSYASVPAGSPVALVNSSSLLEVAVNHGAAAALLG